jgi:hypothetical protein
MLQVGVRKPTNAPVLPVTLTTLAASRIHSSSAFLSRMQSLSRCDRPLPSPFSLLLSRFLQLSTNEGLRIGPSASLRCFSHRC